MRTLGMLILLSMVAMILWQQQSFIYRLQQEQNYIKIVLRNYQDKLDDLSIAYINHHGEYPRRKGVIK